MKTKAFPQPGSLEAGVSRSPQTETVRVGNNGSGCLASQTFVDIPPRGGEGLLSGLGMGDSSQSEGWNGLGTVFGEGPDAFRYFEDFVFFRGPKFPGWIL